MSGTDKVLLQQVMQNELDLVCKWCQKNQLTLNGKRHKKAKFKSTTLKIGNQTLEETTEYKYLGTVLDSNLTGVIQHNKIVEQMATKLTRPYIQENKKPDYDKHCTYDLKSYNSTITGLQRHSL